MRKTSPAHPASHYGVSSATDTADTGAALTTEEMTHNMIAIDSEHLLNNKYY